MNNNANNNNNNKSCVRMPCEYLIHYKNRYLSKIVNIDRYFFSKLKFLSTKQTHLISKSKSYLISVKRLKCFQNTPPSLNIQIWACFPKKKKKLRPCFFAHRIYKHLTEIESNRSKKKMFVKIMIELIRGTSESRMRIDFGTKLPSVAMSKRI